MQRRELDAIIDRQGPAQVLSVLHDHLTPARRERIDRVVAGRLSSIEVALESPYDPHNAAAVVRSAEALGLSSVHVIAASRRVLEFPGTTRGTHRWIHTQRWAGAPEFVAAQQSRGLLLAGAVPGAALSVDEVPTDRPICLIFGNEHEGLAPALADACDLRFGIPIHGFGESFNVSVAAAISLHVLTTQRRRAIGRSGDLDERELARERARCYIRSVDERLVRVLLASTPAEGQ